jgi:hypothetical protein
MLTPLDDCIVFENFDRLNARRKLRKYAPRRNSSFPSSKSRRTFSEGSQLPSLNVRLFIVFDHRDYIDGGRDIMIVRSLQPNIHETCSLWRQPEISPFGKVRFWSRFPCGVWKSRRVVCFPPALALTKYSDEEATKFSSLTNISHVTASWSPYYFLPYILWNVLMC